MAPRFLLDTHVVIRWLSGPKRLSREQARILHESVRGIEPVALSAISLLEIALLVRDHATGIKVSIGELLGQIEANPLFRVLPITCEVAAEVHAVGDALRDPADRVIVATARKHRLRLLTSDERIVDSQLVPVVD